MGGRRARRAGESVGFWGEVGWDEEEEEEEGGGGGGGKGSEEVNGDWCAYGRGLGEMDWSELDGVNSGDWVCDGENETG